MIPFERESYHNKPDAEYQTLCDDAERQDARVMLDAHKGRLQMLRVVLKDGLEICIPIGPGESWRELSSRARLALEAT